MDFVKYIVSEFKSHRLSKADAASLLGRFASGKGADGSASARISPLLHKNTSTFQQIAYASVLRGDEFFIASHRVNGRRLLPGVAYLEMVRAGYVTASGAQETEALEISGVVWPQPFVVEGATKIELLFGPPGYDGENGGSTFQARSVVDGETVVHCEGVVCAKSAAPVRLNVDELRGRMSRGTLDAGAIYGCFEGIGVHFGEEMQGIAAILQGCDEVLAELRLPKQLHASLPEYVLHPTLVDGATQAAIGLFRDLNTAIGACARVPFALESITVLAPCARDMYAWVRYASNCSAGDNTIKLDADLCDADGNVCVQLRGLSSREMQSADASAQEELLLAAPEWEHSALPETASITVAYGEHHLLACDLPQLEEAELRAACCGFSNQAAVLRSDESLDISIRYEHRAADCFRRLVAILRQPLNSGVFFQLAIPARGDGRFLEGLSGLLRTASLENPRLVTQLLIVEPGIGASDLARLANEEKGSREPVVIYENNVRRVLRWREVNRPAPFEALRDEGAYLVTGGLGGIGITVIRDLLQRTSHAVVIAIGRSPLADRQREALQSLSSERVVYRQVDVEDLQAMRATVTAVEAEYGKITAVFHSAGTRSDSHLVRKAEDELLRTLGPKVRGTVHLDLATQHSDLDYFVLFSSLAGVTGNSGQGDYAAANGFLDRFAAWRDALVGNGQRRGRTVSIDWGLWQDGGMGVDAATRDILERGTGMRPLSAESGCRALRHALSVPEYRVMAVGGNLARLRRTFLESSACVPDTIPTASHRDEHAASAGLLEQTLRLLQSEFSAMLGIAAAKLDPQAPFEDYGMDSILAMKLTGRLEEVLGPLPKTLFFECQTTAELAAHLCASYRTQLESVVASPVKTETKPPTRILHAKLSMTPKRVVRPKRERALDSKAEPIAIVGLSGRYPGAVDVAAYWENLRAGKDCIVEVPKERWDWREYYSEDRTRDGHHFSKWGGFIDGVDRFDPLFFNISPAEAEMMDPQERLVLEHAWQALEDAGYTRAALQRAQEEDLAGQVGVYVGVMYGEYQLFAAEAGVRGKRMAFAMNPASIANRVSYFLNLHGPSMTVDTMCSSSLTAIHLACQDLRQGRTQAAIAGGVNVTVHPNKYLMLSAGQFISGAGHCQSFGEGGDGYIPGEGVGVAVLKRLSDAERDGDRIYGVIRGSALNHGGKTNGYSVPNPQAQTAAIRRALREAGVPARRIGYIEAHGTGTKLGDPIEIAALTKAFDSGETGFCRIGSVKSNIGHCESAAGIAGLTKVLLQMQHGELAPSLHAERLNPHIDFERTPFVVNRALQAWEAPEAEGRRLPRLAGISSFGAGGSNAHVIVEEYVEPKRERIELAQVALPLSARTPEQLRQRAQDLREYLEREPEADLAAVGYTLQVGREGMEERLAFTASSVEEARRKLEEFLATGEDATGVLRGQARRGREALGAFTSDPDFQQTVERWIAAGKLGKLLELWTRGLEIDWEKLYNGAKPHRIALPGYPFARERYWIPEAETSAEAKGTGAGQWLHPLLEANTSDLSEHRFSSRFTGEEFFFRDHRVNGEGVLPGAAYLEMARAAVDQASTDKPEQAVLELRNVAWTAPYAASCGEPLHIALAAAGDGAIDFEIYSAANGGADSSHCQGVASWIPAERPRVALDELDSTLLLGLAPKDCYRKFAAMGLDYGPAHQPLRSLRTSPGLVLAELERPDSTGDGFVLHPSLLDGALQACLGLIDTDKQSSTARVPFALEKLRVFAPCTQAMVAVVRYSPGSQSEDPVVKVDIDLCDGNGEVCVELRGLSAREVAVRAETGLVLFTPRWQEQAIEAVPVRWGACETLLCEAARGDVAEDYEHYARACYQRLRPIIESKPRERVLLQVAVPAAGQSQVLAGLAGLLRTAHLENPLVSGQVVLLAAGTSAQHTADLLQREQTASTEALVSYQSGHRQVLRWEAVESGSAEAAIPWHNDGVYLITGGLGGVGLLVAREILDRAPQARVVLGGRSALDAESERKLRSLGPNAVYRQADVSVREQAQALIDSIVSEHGRLNGVLHCAGVLRDGFLLRKTAAEFEQVLAPKVRGAFYLDEATRELELDCFVVFSSIAGALGNVGQGDYAAANGFLDWFAKYRNGQVAAGDRHGRTVSLAWPLWRDGGMNVDAETARHLEQLTGLQPLDTAAAMEALYRSMALGSDRVLIGCGERARLHRLMIERLHSGQAGPAPAAMVDNDVAGDGFEERTRQYLREQLSGLLKLPASRIDAEARLETYGIDSILAIRLTNRLEQVFGSLPKTLFFEYRSLAELAGYFVENHTQSLQNMLGNPTPQAVAAETTGTRPPPARTTRRRPRATADRPKTIDIAIVGIAGTYPLAANLDEFWDNLRNGRDCIAEIPDTRWDHSLYFHPDKNQAAKSYSKWGGFLSEVDKFDPLFFNISPKEAELMDPQERLFLQTAWHCIEDAGYSKERISGKRVGVYAGVMWSHYELFGAESLLGGSPSLPSSSHASIANRVSYFFDFHGPSLAVDTMCSSSLTAIHLACDELRKGNIEAALAGGVSLTLHPYKYLSLSQGNFASTDGHCRSFGAGGDGYVPGEGVGAILLKPLEAAVRGRDRIYGVIRSSALNHGGKTNGYTVPNPQSQGELIREALSEAAIEPQTLGYIEAHGTGTSLGDPIEIAGLEKAFGARAANKQFCPIGSVKSNIGHLESAAGIAAVTKVLLQMKHKELVPSLHAEPPNPNISFDASSFYVQKELTEWRAKDALPRRAGVSSFGAGGSNAHLVIEEFVEREASPSRAEARPVIFVLSARNTAALRRYVHQYVTFFEKETSLALEDVAFTSQMGRTHMPVRLAAVVSDLSELHSKLTLRLHRETAEMDDDGVFFGMVQDSSLGSLIGGAAGTAFLKELIEHRELEKLAKLWVTGAKVDWSLLYSGTLPRRAALPLYPFDRERCWIPAPPAKTDCAKPIVHSEQKQILALYPRWVSKPLTVATGREPAGNTLLLGGSAEFAGSLRKWVAIQPSLELSDENQFHALLATLDARDAFPRTIVYCPPSAPDPSQTTNLERAFTAAFQSLLHLGKTLLRYPSRDVRVISVFGGNAAAPLDWAASGFLKTLAQEHPGISVKLLHTGNATEVGKAAILLDELQPGAWADTEVCYQEVDGDSMCERLVRELSSESRVAQPLAVPVLKHRGVYLLTGGLGELGLIFADYLAQRYQARLILTGRSAPRPEQLALLQHFEKQGAEVLTLRADVCSIEDMMRVVEAAKSRFGSLDGVIHAAGVTRDASITNKTVESCHEVLTPKIQGAVNLDLATAREPLSFFVLFSSAAGVLGNAGQCDYAFANRFLDEFADYRELLLNRGERSGRSISIAWPLWADGGMRISGPALARLEQTAGMAPLPAETGLRFWEQALRDANTSVLPFYGDPSRLAAVFSQTNRPNNTTAPARQTQGGVGPSLELYLKRIIGNELKLEPERIGSSERLESFGIDSVAIGRLNAILAKDLGPVPNTIFYEHETVKELALYLSREFPAAVVSHAPEQEFLGEDAAADNATGATLPEQTTQQHASEAREPIAIVGMHGTFPRSQTLDEFWENLRLGRDLTGPVSRWNWDGAASKAYCRSGGFLDDYDCFDPEFFNMQQREAAAIDPQERLFLQTVWSALEDGGYTRDSLRQHYPKGRSADVGVFVGVTTNSYHLWAPAEQTSGASSSPASLPWSIANRVSYFFDFAGPSMPVDTACSSSLVAVHLACESLLNGECQVAIAGGVNLYLHPAKFVSLCQGGMLSTDNKCRSYGAGGNGFLPGEAVGAVLLKPLSRAQADGDRILGVILGSASSHGGRSNGYSAPNPNSQSALIAQVLSRADVHPETVTCVEGHGTGTGLGDSIEVSALSTAFRRRTVNKEFCSIGSVKANMGHAESAAGMAALAKIAMQMRHGQLAPSINSEQPNPNIAFEDSPFHLQRELTDWKPAGGAPRRALINSFGAGGVSAAILVEEPPVCGERTNFQGPFLFTLSAKNDDRLREYAERMMKHLASDRQNNLAEICYTLQVGREAMEARLAIVAGDLPELAQRLEQWLLHGACPEAFQGVVRNAQPDQQRLRCQENADLDQIAAKWVDGAPVDWDSLYHGSVPRKVDLPTYPFARQRCWFQQSEQTPAIVHAPPQLHPLLSSNSSTLRECSFQSVLRDDGFYVDHKVGGEPILPAAAFLEIAFIAGNLAGAQRVRRLADVAWMHPLSFRTGPQTLRTVLKRSGGDVEFEMSSIGNGDKLLVHSVGRLIFNGGAGRTHAAVPVREKIAAARRRIEGAELYRMLDDYGLGYGPSFRVVEELGIGNGYAVSRLSLPDHLKSGFEEFLLHPCILDGALQTVAGLAYGLDTRSPQIPFALDELETFKPVPERCFAYAEFAPSSGPRQETRIVNIRLLNDKGEVLAALNNLLVRAIHAPAEAALAAAAVS